MRIQHQSNIAFVKYQPTDSELYFNHLGQTSKYCYWKPREFYVAASANLIESVALFKNDSLRSIGKKLESIQFLDRTMVIQSSGGESEVEIHMFNMRIDESEEYFFDGLLIDFNLSEAHMTQLIEAINKGLWSKVKFTVFINESHLLTELYHAEQNKFSNFSLSDCDFNIEI